MSGVLDQIRQAACTAGRHIVLAEGEDPRIIKGGTRAQADGLAKITFLGCPERIGNQLVDGGWSVSDFAIIDPSATDLTHYQQHYYALRQHKNISKEDALDAVRDPLTYACMMVRLGEADGTVAGAVATTADTVRAAFQVIGRAPEANVVSSVFLIICEAEHFTKKGTFIFGDCALVVEPDAEELCEIALASADSCRRFVGEEPRIAMLSFSTAGSASHPLIDKVQKAVTEIRKRAPDLTLFGDIQFDSAFVPHIAASKAKNSPIQGDANVFIFPGLEAGNIGYKIAERIGGATAVGPILQGLAKPANDLSRGCSAEDVYDLIAITAVQAG